MSAHTYSVHFTITAEGDAEARAALAALMPQVVAARREVGDHRTYLTDTDDWAEHVTATCSCGQPSADRLRDGTGGRRCAACGGDGYEIYDV